MKNPLVEHGKKYQGMDDIAGKDNEVSVEASSEVVDGSQQTETNPVNTSVSAIVDKVSLKPKAEPKVQLTVYIDELVSRKFATFGDMYGKGSKSELINDFLAEALKDFKPKPKRR